MAYYHVHGLIPDEISQSEGYKAFKQYIASGAPKDNFDGFELVGRFHAPETGEVLSFSGSIIILGYQNTSVSGEQNSVSNGKLQLF